MCTSVSCFGHLRRQRMPKSPRTPASILGQRGTTLTWAYSSEGVDWQALAEVYRAAPLGDKSPADLKTVFANSRYICFVYDGEWLVGAGRVLADGRDCAYI